MIENQAIFLVISVFFAIYLGIFLRYYLISKSSYTISKFFLVKFFIRSLIIAVLLSALYLMDNPRNSKLRTNQEYIILSQDWKIKSKSELKFEINEKLLKVENQQNIGCIYKEKNQYFVLIPIVKRQLFEKYVNQFDLKILPTFPIKINDKKIEELTNNRKYSGNILQTIYSNFNIYNISELRNYLLILLVAIFALESLFIKKIIKN